ncbi:MAG: hypothetical protein UW04_C0019G0010 [Parcubacteria group bacterium GW2011_GWB1_43_8]|nr:MAG: hypothetical protein UW04_C0019G0010 [Parcubacteria group bacterium GW2011_GWB1_43_8]
MKIIKKIIPFGLMAMPFAAGAVENADDIFSLVENILGKLAPMLIAVAVIILLVAIVNYIRAGEDEEKRGKAKSLMIFGIIGLFVMVSIWGLVAILSGTFNLNNDIPDTVDELLPNF